MRIASIIFLFAAAAAAAWWFMVVPLLRQWDQYCQFYATLEAVQATRWFKIRMAVQGLKLRLVSWLLIIAPSLLSGLQLLTGSSLLPFLPALPEKYQQAWPMIIAGAGVASLLLEKFMAAHPAAPVPPNVSELEIPTVPDKPDVVMTTAGPQVLDVVPAAPAPAPEAGPLS